MKEKHTQRSSRLYERIYYLVQQVPYGKVVSYGQVARIVGGCTARMVGYAMSAVRPEHNVPWQRVINSKGEVSQHGDGFGTSLQRTLLVDEGVVFDGNSKVNFDLFGWDGPDTDWEETYYRNHQASMDELDP